MDNYKRYTIGLISFIIAGVVFILASCYYLQPVVGDTTRLSGYSENDFGWNVPQMTFVQAVNPLQNEYSTYSDMLVVGDSFSFGGVLGMMNYPWQTFVTANTGLSVATISHYITKTVPPSYDPSLIPSIVSSEYFLKAPPKVFVLEIVERQLNLLPNVSGDCKLHNRIHKNWNILPLPKPTMVPTKAISRSFERQSLRKQIEFTVKFWETYLSFNRGDNPAYLFSLVNSRLFSNKRSDALLVYEGDMDKRKWDDKVIEDVKCKLINMQNMVQSNGVTHFVIMIAPDKLTVYSPFLADSSLESISPIARLAADTSLNILRLDIPLQTAVKEGNIDVYLPNDTHWASKGQQVAAETLINYISNSSNHN